MLPLPDPKGRDFSHNHFAALMVLLAGIFLGWVVHQSQESIPLAELAGVRVLPTALYIGVVFLMLRFLGGWRKVRVTRYLLDGGIEKIPFAIYVGALILGLAHVVASH